MAGTSNQRGRGRRHVRRRRGAVTVEFALVLPVLLLFVFAALEFSRMNMIRHTVDNAAYEGARRGITPGATAAKVRKEAQRILDAVGTRGAQIDVEPSTINDDTPEVTVRINVPCDSNGWLAPVYFRGKTLSGECTLTRELF